MCGNVAPIASELSFASGRCATEIPAKISPFARGAGVKGAVLHDFQGSKMMLRPFLSFYGGKWRIAPHYSPPHHKFIVEPFAGSAGYSTRYHERQVTLYDVDPIIAGVWDYLIKVPSSELLALPSIIQHVDEVPGPQEARWLVGFWITQAVCTPRKSVSKLVRDGSPTRACWGQKIKERLARQVEFIRHWKIVNGSYETIPNHESTWFIDPPYVGECGRHYRFNKIDFQHLGKWCTSRLGYVIVCESNGASWLPFKPFRSAHAGPRSKNKSEEVVFYGGHES